MTEITTVMTAISADYIEERYCTMYNTQYTIYNIHIHGSNYAHIIV